jgi:2-amino-4-hydroxy-6-hydroxymethyldihydropteridine diphosphokinase
LFVFPEFWSGGLDLEKIVVLALGANVPQAQRSILESLNSAIERLQKYKLIIASQSSWWESVAWPNPLDPAYINGVVLVEAQYSPLQLLGTLQQVEREFGRQRSIPNAPRTLDLDLIAFGREIMTTPELDLPHPRAEERLFVMGPLAEIAPDWRHPISNRTAAELAAAASIGRDAHPLQRN